MSSYIVYIPSNQTDLCKLFDENKITERTISFDEFKNMFNPSVNALKNQVNITESLDKYQEITEKIIQMNKYKNFINSKAREEFCKNHGNNYRGPSNRLSEYEIECRNKYPFNSFDKDF
jgi:hypothetical protein